MSEQRIQFVDKKSRKDFFLQLKKSKSGCKTYEELAKKIKIPVGRLRLYANGARGIPKEDFDNWVKQFSVLLGEKNYKIINMNQVFSSSAKKGVKVLKQKYGEDWAKITGSRSMKKLQKNLENPEIRRKWRKSVEASLRNKFGPNFYTEMGRLGGRKAIATADKEELKARYKKMFRKSFRYKIQFEDKNYRSKKEVEVAKALIDNKIQFDYEKELFGYYPDFVLDNKTIIEVVGLEWKPHIERTKKKIELFVNNGFTVVLYTYPNMAKYFGNLPVKIALNESDLMNVLGYNRG